MPAPRGNRAQGAHTRNYTNCARGEGRAKSRGRRETSGSAHHAHREPTKKRTDNKRAQTKTGTWRAGRAQLTVELMTKANKRNGYPAETEKATKRVEFLRVTQ